MIPRPAAQLIEILQDADEPLPEGAEANPQPSPPRVDETGEVPQDDDEDARARGLSTLNQMNEEL